MNPFGIIIFFSILLVSHLYSPMRGRVIFHNGNLDSIGIRWFFLFFPCHPPTCRSSSSSRCLRVRLTRPRRRNSLHACVCVCLVSSAFTIACSLFFTRTCLEPTVFIDSALNIIVVIVLTACSSCRRFFFFVPVSTTFARKRNDRPPAIMSCDNDDGQSRQNLLPVISSRRPTTARIHRLDSC